MTLGRGGVLAAVIAASVAQAGQTGLKGRPPRPPIAISAESGLVFHLSEGVEGQGAAIATGRPAPAAPLDAAATQRVLDRLPPLAPLPDDQQPFAFRERSLPPPRAGATVVQQFPPPMAPPSGAPDVPASGPATVLRRSPEGKVPLASHLSVTFSQPMVPVGAHDDLATKDRPVRVTPEPPGQWRWVGTRTVLFEPTVRFPMATTYRVEAAGASWQFTTPAPTLTVKHPEGPARRDAIVFAAFDQRIDPQAVLPHVRVIAGQGVRAVRLATNEEVRADEIVQRLATQAGEGRWLAFRASDPLPPDAGVTVTIDAGTPSAEGPLATPAAQSWGFRTFGPLRVTAHRCGWQEGRCPPGTPWQIDLSNPIDGEAFTEAMVRVEPAVAGLTVSAHGQTLVLQGRTKARTTYRVTLTAALPDTFGQTLGTDHTVTFTVGPAQPMLSAAGGEMVVLDPAAGPRLSVYSTGLTTLDVTIHRVTPADWPAYRGLQERAMRDRLALPPAPGTRVVSRAVPVAGSPDELVETAIDLRDALPAGLGHAVVTVTPGGRGTTPDQWPGRVITWVQGTRIGLDAFVDAGRLVAWATALQDGRPLAGIDVELVPGGARAETSADGLASLALGEPANALVARRGNDVAFLPARTAWWDKSGWQRVEAKDALRWMVFDDRGLYRPGEDARIKGWVRLIGRGPGGDVAAAPAAVQSVSYVLKDSQGNAVAKGVAAVNTSGGFDLTLPLPPTMNLGGAMLELTTAATGVSGTTHTHAIQVQEFRRPEFEVTASANPGPHFVGGEALVTARAAYFAGGALPDAPVTWTVRSTPGQFTPPGRDDFSFGTWVPWWRPWGGAAATRTESFQSRTDPGGEHRLKIAFDRVTPPQASQVEAEASVMDVNRQAWTSTARLLVHPADVYVGLRAPRLFVQPGERLLVEAIVVDLDGHVVTGRPVNVVAERMEWKQVKGQWTEAPADREECPHTSTANPTGCGFKPDQGGSYRVTAVVTDAKGRPNQTRLQLWVAGGATPPRRDVAQEEVTLVPAQKEYRAGATAEILVLAPFADAEGLMTLRRSGLVRTERFRIQGSSHTLRIPIEDAFVPNVHVQVDLVGAAMRTSDDGTPDPQRAKRPAFASGTIDLAVPPLQRTLAVSVAARDAALEPGGKTDLAIDVKDAAGRPVTGAELAVVVVDEAVLALTAYRIPDPLDVFYAKREPGVADHHLRAHVVLGRPADVVATEELAMDAMQSQSFEARGAVGGMPLPASAPMARQRLAKGMVAENKAEPAPPIALRADFRALALFAPSVRTDANGHATVPVTVPESLTRYRITVVAVSGPRDFGKGESTMTARLPLMVRPSAPRFLNFGDRFELPVVLQNQTATAMTVDVAVRAGNARLTDGAGRRVTVPANDRVEVRFPVTTDRAGTARFQVGAASGRFADAAEVVLPVWTPATTEAFATYGQIDGGAVRQPIETPRDVIPQFGGLEVTTSSTALSALTDAVLYLTAYPFECSEQLSSRVLAVAALKDVLTAFQARGLPSAADMTAAVARDVELLGRIQNDDGGFPFWRRGDPSWPYVSIHVAHALQRAKEKGFAVPEPMLARAREYVTHIEQHMPREYGPEVRRSIVAYALNVRARMGDRDAGRARGLLREAAVEKLSFEALGWILPVLSADPGSQAEVAQIVRHLENRVTETAAAAHFAVAYGDQEYLILYSDRRADAIVLEGLIAARAKSDLIPKIVEGLLAHRRGGRWENTQENTFVLLALDRYFAVYEAVTPDFAARLWLGPQYAGEHAFRGRTTERHQVEVPMAQLGAPGATQDLILGKEGPGRLYYRVGLRYAPASLRLDAADHGFTVERVYEGVDDAADVRRDANGRWRIRAGARVRVRLTMIAPARRYHVALVDPLPAGLEALNPALATTGALPPAAAEDTVAARSGWWWWSRAWFEHQNLRDERVEAFTTLLWEGVHKYSYVARATTPGTFVVPPPKAEEMYHPETFGRGATDTVTVE